MYPELIVRFSLPNLTRLKYHKNCIWQFKKHNRGKKKKNVREDKPFGAHTQVCVTCCLSVPAEGHLHLPAPKGAAQEPSNCPVCKSHILGDQWDPPCLHTGLLG